MYLKSLTLKGFKSFADKVTLSFEEGITAIVGPNGSGKSNISDAVLWVLGERNAKHLRGGAMEDVIFAGSSARKSTSLAEVELVLDNSDQVLPVEYSEVVIARRMYRSGESEYLINGSIARRMDVLDILHDTGLGVGTHSIISQGSIDSVLQSKPEERRALIEEAAGVLKHKQRLARSARKLERMSAHVDRVSDIVSEVQRQLGPLERRAAKAKRFEELSAELKEAQLCLAADDLRNLQLSNDQITQRTSELESNLDAHRTTISDVDRKIAELQAKLRDESHDVGELSRQQRQATSALDKVRSQIALMRDRKRSSQTRASEIAASIEVLNSQVLKHESELSSAKLDFDSSCEHSAVAQKSCDEIFAKLSEYEEKRTIAQKEISDLTLKVEALENEDSVLRREQALTQESLTSGLAHLKVLSAHIAELELSVSRCTTDYSEAEVQANELESALAIVEDQEKQSRALVAACVKAKESARIALDEAYRQEQSINAQIDAIDAIEKKRAENAGEARKWLFNYKESTGLKSDLLSHLIKAEKGYESLVELMLGSDMDLMLIDDVDTMSSVISALSDSDTSGEASFIVKNSNNLDNLALIKEKIAHAIDTNKCSFLADHISVQSDIKHVIDALIGDVIVCPSVNDSIDAHQKYPSARYVTKDGAIVWPSGKVTVGLTVLEEDQGTLARLRHLEELKVGLIEAGNITQQARNSAKDAEDALADAQTESLKLSERLAELRGSALSARNMALVSSEKLNSVQSELSEVVASKDKAEADVERARPDVERFSSRLSELQTELEQAKDAIKSYRQDIEPINQMCSDLNEQLAQARLDLAKATEKKNYNELMVARHIQDIDSNKNQLDTLSSTLHAKQVSIKRIDVLISVFETLEACASSLVIKLEQASLGIANAQNALHVENENLRLQSSEAHSAFDFVNQQLADIRVEKAKIELHVETAVNLIVDQLNTPLDVAFELPLLENRNEVEETVQSLSKRIANLGTINPDAAKEYDDLKDRYDYLSGQLSDLKEASRVLTRINRMIEDRMKDDFLQAFEDINVKFQENFALLFPGGNAFLLLENPEDIDNTGVEVNAQPAGKRISKMSLMSGGEKSLIAIALLFALYRSRPTPFYILDEVEAALDDTNLRRLTSFIDALRGITQLIMITHQRRTMEMADVLFGVSMQADGVTKVVSQKLERALEFSE